MTDDIFFAITDGPDIIKIQPLKWTYPDAELDSDKNWIQSKITVKLGAFRGEVYCELMTTDFELFKRQIKSLYNNLKGTASFKPIEQQIELKIEGDGIGHFIVDSEVMDDVGIGNRLISKITFDQTQIPLMVKQLNSIEGENRKLRFVSFSNGGIIGYFNDGTISACARCDLTKENIEKLRSENVLRTYKYQNHKIIIEESDTIDIKNNNENWAMLDYQWMVKLN